MSEWRFPFCLRLFKFNLNRPNLCKIEGYFYVIVDASPKCEVIWIVRFIFLIQCSLESDETPLNSWNSRFLFSFWWPHSSLHNTKYILVVSLFCAQFLGALGEGRTYYFPNVMLCAPPAPPAPLGWENELFVWKCFYYTFINQ